ncbi:hypothetical protein [Alteromonas sp. a30]|uniref:hypothetical protein n=1 Tax=Alteromonas sp. a30 TaxID=2730917 RepID=UPI00227F1C21|nr:hypothetical protein [Alteromonas sp. a30]MCY7293860.1 hypothetical protein [Alteromonas sp. a30]
MRNANKSVWKRYQYLLNGMLLALPVLFLYQSLTPSFPASLGTKTVGEFEISAMPFDANPPYLHDGVYVKDFMVTFTKGNVDEIRQAYLNIGEKARPLNQMQRASEGILHGSRYGKHVHALASESIHPSDKVWLTIEHWDGRIEQVNWDWR